MTDSRDLKRGIAAFYDQYHLGRNRQPNQWMLTHYWPAFQGRILEVGGGTLYLQDKPYYLADLSVEAVRRASSSAIPGVVADGSHLPFRDREFDTVACHDVLEHVPDPSSFLADMCRVCKKRVLIAGPNYINGQQGHLDRRLVVNLWRFLFGDGQGAKSLEKPHLSFDAEWSPDKDAVMAPNAAWVAKELQKNGMHILQLRTWEYNTHWLNRVPAVKCLGPFMFVVGERNA